MTSARDGVANSRHKLRDQREPDDLRFELATSEGALRLTTRGLRGDLGRELQASVETDWAVDPAKELVCLAANEFRENPHPSTEWSSAAGFRRLHWRADADVVRAEERDGSTIRLSIQRAAAEWGAQRWVNETYGADWDPITERQLVSLAPAILDPSAAVEGTRYPMNGEMSGWMLIGEHFAGDADDLRIEHAAHLAEARPDLVRYLALPVGWTFFSAPGEGESVSQLAGPDDRGRSRDEP